MAVIFVGIPIDEFCFLSIDKIYLGLLFFAVTNRVSLGNVYCLHFDDFQIFIVDGQSINTTVV